MKSAAQPVGVVTMAVASSCFAGAVPSTARQLASHLVASHVVARTGSAVSGHTISRSSTQTNDTPTLGMIHPSNCRAMPGVGSDRGQQRQARLMAARDV